MPDPRLENSNAYKRTVYFAAPSQPARKQHGLLSGVDPVVLLGRAIDPGQLCRIAHFQTVHDIHQAIIQMTHQAAYFKRQRKPVAKSALHLKPLPKLVYVGPLLPEAVGLTGMDEARQRLLVLDVEPDKLVHREPPVQVDHGAFKRARILSAARMLRFHSSCRLRSAGL